MVVNSSITGVDQSRLVLLGTWVTALKKMQGERCACHGLYRSMYLVFDCTKKMRGSACLCFADIITVSNIGLCVVLSHLPYHIAGRLFVSMCLGLSF